MSQCNLNLVWNPTITGLQMGNIFGLTSVVFLLRIPSSGVYTLFFFHFVDNCISVVLLLTDGLYKSKFVKMWDRETLQLTDSIYSILRTLYRWDQCSHWICRFQREVWRVLPSCCCHSLLGVFRSRVGGCPKDQDGL